MDGLLGKPTNNAGSRVLVESLHTAPQIDLNMISVFRRLGSTV